LSLYLTWLIVQGQMQSSRARIHWLGNARRPRRPERALLFVLIIGALLALCPHQYLLWSAYWGGGAAIFVNLYMIYALIPRKRYHWVGG